MTAREEEMVARTLLNDPTLVDAYFREKRWAELAALVRYARRDVSVELAQTDPALYRQLREQITRFFLRGGDAFVSEKLEALATLAAGAAHELATPLSTIAVVARELERTLDRLSLSPDVQDDIVLIRREVDRCRTILDRMANDAGQPSGEPLRQCTVSTLLNKVIDGSVERTDVLMQVDPEMADAILSLPIEGIAQALRGLVRNAIDASPEGVSIVLAASRAPSGRVAIRVRDRGTGMTEAILQRVAEPFFTTKAPGAGMGLGVFLARTLVERLGGTLAFESAPHQGTVATVELPIVEASDSRNRTAV